MLPAVAEVIATDEFGTWYAGLTVAERKKVAAVVDVLERAGIALGTPYSSEIKGSKTVALRELRPNQGRSPLRVFYAFDPRRDAVLILGGDKSGVSSRRFYERMVRECERIWRAYLDEQGLDPSSPER